MVMRGQARKETQHSATEDGGDQDLMVDVRKKTEKVVKKSTKGRRKT